MLSKKASEDMKNELFDLILSLKSREECKLLFDDLCTGKEINNMAQRVRAAKLLMQNKTYNEVIAETDISSATLSRVSRCVQYGEGYTKFIK
ncbi:MAG: TrpR-related protein YerC/YecD [Clostridia bacterium]|nr:TrpR-related protein YerC/YecD [Clostridia bacterium]